MNSGAFKFVILYRATFDTYEVIAPRNVHLGDTSVVEVIGMSSIFVEAIVKGNINQICIKDVVHVPKLHVNLFSVSKLMSNGLKVQSNLNECIVKSYNNVAL